MFLLVNFEFNLTADLIGACNKYFWNYQEETYILETSLANHSLEDPRVIQDYSFLSCGRVHA